MTIFISYSHADKEKVDNLASHMVKRNAQVWVDTWELNVGDSLIQRVQEAITGADALLVILSKSSVQSEWCKKELSSGLIRELHEKRVVVLPVVIDDCEIPLFLRDKMYADLRTNFESGLDSIMDAVARISNSTQSRIEKDGEYTDWSVDWYDIDGLYTLRYTIVNAVSAAKMTLLTEIIIICNEVLTARQKQFQTAGLDWIGRMIISEALFEYGSSGSFRVVLDSSLPKRIEGAMKDSQSDAEYKILAHCRRLGEDNGKHQLINIGDYLKNIKMYMRASSRQPNKEELGEMLKIIATPMRNV